MGARHIGKTRGHGILHRLAAQEPSETSIELLHTPLSRRCSPSAALSRAMLRSPQYLLRYARTSQGVSLSVPSRSMKRLLWLEATKAIALVLIVFNHALESMGEYPSIFNPKAGWAPLAERIEQLSPTTGGLWDLTYNVFRYPGLLGEVGVQLFVIASGLGLTLSAIRRKGTGAGFLRRRLNRIAPTWVTVHVLALVASVPLLLFIGGRSGGRVAAVWDARFWASLVGFRITPETIYYLVPAWWFIALLIQLYLVFPLLYRWLGKLGPVRFWYVIGGGIGIKLAGLLVLNSYLDVWSRGAFFVTRLPEFAFGMLVAVWLTAETNPLRHRWTIPSSLLAIAVGVASGLYLVGNAWGPFLYGAGLFVILYRTLSDRELTGRVSSITVWVGLHSLSLFIVHQPAYQVLMPGGRAGPVRVLGGFVVATGAAVVGAIVLERIVDWLQRRWNSWAEQGILARRSVAIGGIALLVYGALVGADSVVRSVDPQEVLGWGERPSLVADDELGWRLRPNQTTRLRWQSYDYEVTANRFGFPGPVDDPGPGELRILALGDAFTSAEGVDTPQAWPRLLEGQLGDATVWNGAITGFGPQQYLTAAAELAPLLDPDVVVVGFFVNEFEDAVFEYDSMQDGIGFGRPDPAGVVPSLQWAHVSKWLRFNVTEPILALAGRPNQPGYALGYFSAFEPGSLTVEDDGYQATLTAMQGLRSLLPGTRIMMLLVPASIQVCEPQDLDYFPSNVDLADFDLDQPQRLAMEIAAATDIEVMDLRALLRGLPDCPYQPGNMHWTEAGHEAVAAAVAARIGSG